MNTVTIPLVTISIKRNLETAVKDVFAHEVDLYYALHGADNVQVLDAEAGEKSLETDSAAEYERLRLAFDTKNYTVVDKVYRHHGELAQRMGIKAVAMDHRSERELAHIDLGHKKPKAGKKPEKG